MHLAAGSIVAGKFRLDRPLAHGGMGSVWVAFNTHLEVPVALKFMAPAMVGSPELVARFEREAKAAAQLRNPHVVQVFEHGVDRGTPFIAMELLEGEDLGARLRAQGRLSLAETSRILGDVCKALRRAHEKGLVHRDLKPANIFLCKHEEYEVVKVLDFGIAKSMADGAEGDVTKTGALVGSPHYMAPEQARRTNKQVDHRSDLWSLGIIAFRCVTGALPFAGDNVIEVLVQVCTETAPPASSVARDLGPDVDRFFARALSRDPDKRFQSAKEMADAMMRMAGIEPPLGLDRSWSDGKAPPPRPSDAGLAQAPPRLDRSGPAPRLDRSGSAAAFPRVPEPRGSQPRAPQPSQPFIADEPSDDAKTVPIQDPRAQQVVQARPWTAEGRGATSGAGRPDPGTRAGGPGTMAGSDVAGLGASPTFAVPATFAASMNAPTLSGAAPTYAGSGLPGPLPAAGSPGSRAGVSGSPQAAGSAAPAAGASGPYAAMPGYPGPVMTPPPGPSAPGPTLIGQAGAAPTWSPAPDGTLTSAGAELPGAARPKRDKPWIALAAVGAVVVVVLVVASAVLLGRGSGDDSDASAGAAPQSSTSTAATMASPEPTPRTPAAATEAGHGSAASTGSAAPAQNIPAIASETPTATAAASQAPVTPASSGTASAKSSKTQPGKPTKIIDEAEEARRALVGPTSTAKALPPPPTAKPSAGLHGPDF